jgi:transposase
MNTFEPWVLDWVNEQRRKGAKGLEVKYLNSNYYVYRSTSYRDKNLRKARKKSTYIGRLDRERGLIQSSQKYRSNVYPKSMKTYGDAMLLNIALKDFIPLLKENFDFWEDIYALALVRIYGYVPLKRARLRWQKLHNSFNINPNLEPKHLSEIHKIIGSDKISQNNIFRSLLTASENFAYDISAIITRSSINISDIGYNKEMSYALQIELILISSTETKLPALVRIVPESIRDVETLRTSVEDIGIEKITFIMDRGIFSEDNVRELVRKKISFVVPTKRNSFIYGKIKETMNEHFFYRERLIKCSKKRWSLFFLYLYEDNELKKEEEEAIYKEYDENIIDYAEFRERLDKAGRILIISNLNKDCKEIFEMYKSRDVVEKHFDIAKNMLKADILYLRDDYSIFGHIFVSFLSLYGYCKIENMLRERSLLDKISPMDVLERFSTVYIIGDENRKIITKVSKKARELDEKLGTNITLKNRS